MQCERCGAPRENDASACARCGNKFPPLSSCEDAGIPSIDSFGENSRAEKTPSHGNSSAQESASAQVDASSHVDSSDTIEPVFNPVAAAVNPAAQDPALDAVDPAATTETPAATPVASPAATPAVAPVASSSPQTKGFVSGAQNSSGASFLPQRKIAVLPLLVQLLWWFLLLRLICSIIFQALLVLTM